jgi:hypothetical protein
MIKLTALAVFLCLSQATFAETALKFGGVSYHLVSETYTNSFHRTLVIESNGYSVGYARNSYDQDIFMAGAYFERPYKHVTARIHLSAIYGYSQCYGEPNGDPRRLCPMIAPELRLNAPYKPSVTLFGDALVLTLTYDL